MSTSQRKDKQKERTRTMSDSEDKQKRSKFNLKLDKIKSSSSSTSGKTFSAAGSGIKWLFSRKKSSKSSKGNKASISSTSSSSGFINPIPIVAAAKGSHVSGFEVNPSVEEMRERPNSLEEQEYEALGQRKESTMLSQRSEQYPGPEHKRFIPVPRMLPTNKISYGYQQDPSLQNFQLQGSAPPYPGKKLIFRPCAPNQTQRFAVPPGMSSSPPRQGNPRPRMLHPQQSGNPYYHSRSPPPPRARMGPPCPPGGCHPSQYHHNNNSNLGSPLSNFPNQRPNPTLLFPPNNYNHQRHNSNSSLHGDYLKPPIPKERRSLKENYSSTNPYEEQQYVPPPWVERRAPPHHPNSNNMRHLSSSCVNLSVLPDANNDRNPVIRKYSSQSRISRSSCGSRSDYGDSSSSIPWFRWFASRLEQEGLATVGRKSSNTSKSNDGTNANCIQCNKKLPTSTGGLKNLISAPVSCSICSIRMCKGCALWDSTRNSYRCGHCQAPRSIDKRKNFWFDHISSGHSVRTNLPIAERDKVNEDVREHLERVIESQVDEGIDAVSLGRLFDHPQYELIFHRFHAELSDALVNLGYCLKLAIENKPMPADETTPTSAHTALTDLLTDIKEVAIHLPLMDPANNNNSKTPSPETRDSALPSYEDILSTAVINKAILNGQKSKRKIDSPLFADSAIQTDSEYLSENSIGNGKYKDVRGWVTNLEKVPPQSHPNLSDDDLSMGTSSSNWSNEGNNQRNFKGQNQQIVIEEQVEEITTTYESDSDLSRHPPSSRNKKGKKTIRQRNAEHANNFVPEDDSLLGVDVSNFDTRAPFPEGGVDIVPPPKIRGRQEEEEEQDQDSTGILVAQISEWEQNWLFKRRNQLLRRRNMMAESVQMLVPNPNDDDIQPQIGDDNALDVSDLSDNVNDNEGENSDLFPSSDSEEELAEDAENIVDGITIVIRKPEVETQDKIKSQEVTGVTEDETSTEVPNGEMKELSINPTKESKKQVASIPSPRPRKTVSNPIEAIKFVKKPMDVTVGQGKTARFSCIVTPDSPDFSVAWFCDGQLITTKESKWWAVSCGRNEHYLYISDCQKQDAGKYHLSLFDFKGNEAKLRFTLSVEASQNMKPEPPNFTLLQDIVNSNKDDAVINIPFEVTGHPEPFLQIFKNDVEITKLSHVGLVNSAEGHWNLELRKKETDFPVVGEYIAVAKNTQGMTRVTFVIDEGDREIAIVSVGEKETMRQQAALTKKHLANGHSKKKSPSPDLRPASADSETSSAGEAPREQYHTLNRNHTLVKEDYEADLSDSSYNSSIDPSKMTIAEREKKKWMNPVNLPNNPYAPENLAKRIRQRESGNYHSGGSVSGDVTITSSDDERNPVIERKQNLSKYARDYYVPGVTPQSTRLRSTPVATRSPSVTSVSSMEGPREKKQYHSPSIVPSSVTEQERPIAQSPSPVPEIKEANAEAQSPNLEQPSAISPPVPKSRTPSPKQRYHPEEQVAKANGIKAMEGKTVKLPSVKKLAQQFQISEEKPEPLKVNPIQNPRTLQLKEQRSFQQVHSLTARSVSRQFREGLKQAQPLPTDINIKIKSTENNNKEKKETERDNGNINNNHNETVRLALNNNDRYDSSDSLSSCTSDTPNGALCRKKGGSSTNILARAAFWDKRVQEGIVDDQLVIDKFPKMEI